VRKGTILIPSGPGDDPGKKHLFVVLTDPVGPEEWVLLASFSSYSGTYFCDDTCVIEEGTSGHAFLRRKSFVRYQKLRIEPMDKLRAGISTGLFEMHDPLPDEVFERVVAGVMQSPFAAPKYKNFLQKFLGAWHRSGGDFFRGR
jgi:hypothetical protein